MASIRLNSDEWRVAAMWTVLVVVLCGHTLLKPYSHTTYPIFARAGENWMAGQHLYGKVPGVDDVFRYSPLVAALFAPLSLLPDGPAGALWRLLNVAALLAALAAWTAVVVPGAPTGKRRAWLFLLVLPLAIPSLHNGQSNALVLALVLASVAAAACQRWNLCSVCLALACMLKVYPLAVGLLLVALYPRRLLGRLTLALVVAFLLPFLLQQPSYVWGEYRDWVTSLDRDNRYVMSICSWPRDVRLLFEVWLVPLPAGLYRVVQVLAGAGCAALCLTARAAGWTARQQLTLLTGLGCCWMTAFGPATESSTYLLLGPSLAAALMEVWPAASWRLRTAVGAAYALLVLSYVAKWFPWGKYVSPLALQPLAAVIFLGYLVLLVLLARKQQALPAVAEGPVGRAA